MPLPTPYVLAAPGYLAGGNDWEHLTDWLLRGHGWRDASTIDYHTLLASPDGYQHVGLDRRGTWTWYLHATRPDGRHWTATLGAHLPVEYVTALVETMLRPATRHRPDTLRPLYAAGWTRDTEADAIAAVSPDGLVRFTQENAAGPSPHTWHAACTVDGYTWWSAAFTAHTPPRLVAAFTRSLACPDPLPRMAIGIPMYRCGPYTRRTQTAFGWDDEQALLEARIAEARRHRLSSAPVSRLPSSAVRPNAARVR
ncbi:DUF317 domain-containing protein [Streptomyces sp. GbtcB6]|uniref:DUF317 domain-containing protein n=1 Tax=Streptomyces sp. GbtcB6 TaxID=2824751 RepID=UPI001C2FCB69|nr:DUF317 domain-containing protein [Streptomyces sp. GbtcB6]